MKIFLKSFIVTLFLISITYHFSSNNEYLKYKNTKCIVLDKIQTRPGYKSSAMFYLILKEEKNRVFELSVSPATFSQSKIGDKVNFNLREMDIKQTRKDNFIFFFGEVFLMAITTISVGGTILILLIKK